MPAEPSRHPVLATIGLPDPTSRLAVGVVLLSVTFGVVAIESVSEALALARGWVVGHFDWLFVGVANAALAIVVLLALHPAGRLRLGPPDGRPEFGRFAWFSMLLSAGLASGLLYWATAEPILHQQANPLLSDPTTFGLTEPGADVTAALRITVLHWGAHGWALYVISGLAIAVYAYRHDQPVTFRTALYPWLGSKWTDRWPGRAVDLLALFGTVCGVATSVGLSAASINATLGSLFTFDVSTAHQIGIIAFVCGLGVLSVLSGLTRGIRLLSEVNVWVSLLLLLAFATLGPSSRLAQLFFETLADYARHGISTGLWLGTSAKERAWQADWTLFYWGWWLAWTPFVSLFIARISKGRTIREFVVAVALVPSLVTVLWMTVLGGTAITHEAASPGSITAAVNEDYSLGLVAVLHTLGPPELGSALTAIAAFLLLTWLVTSLDSATLVICHLLGVEERVAASVFWGFTIAAVSAILLRADGLGALQAASIVIGLPLAVLLVGLGAGLLRDLWRGSL